MQVTRSNTQMPAMSNKRTQSLQQTTGKNSQPAFGTLNVSEIKIGKDLEVYEKIIKEALEKVQKRVAKDKLPEFSVSSTALESYFNKQDYCYQVNLLAKIKLPESSGLKLETSQIEKTFVFDRSSGCYQDSMQICHSGNFNYYWSTLEIPKGHIYTEDARDLNKKDFEDNFFALYEQAKASYEAQISEVSK